MVLLTVSGTIGESNQGTLDPKKVSLEPAHFLSF
jgi:hypothetical protein